MKKIIFYLLIFLPFSLSAQFDGIVGTPGCKAIHCEDARFVEWATGCTVTRGYLNIANQAMGVVSYGSEYDAIGVVTNSTTDVVSLGDGGEAILTFQTPVANGEGADFAVFENAMNDVYLELGFVEVSSDGIHYFRFSATSNTQTATQVGGYGTLDATKINNLAGKYRAGYGVPFDLDELPDDIYLDKNNIQFVKIIDVIGTIDPNYASRDHNENIINDPYPTSFASGGFDLAGVGVINNKNNVSILYDKKNVEFALYPNVATATITIRINGLAGNMTFKIVDVNGKTVLSENINVSKNFSKILNISNFAKGIYFVALNNSVQKLIVY